MKLSKEDLYFVTTYYLEELNGRYPLVETINGKTDETMFYLLKHFLRSILKLRSMHVEIQVVELLRNEKDSDIIRHGMLMFPEWKQRADSHERIIMIAKQLLRIKSLSRITEEQNPTDTQEQKTEEASISEERKQPKYKSIDHYTAETGKRFRMTKEQKQRFAHLSPKEAREAAFMETYYE